jgi:hypothetical protein
MTLHKYFSYPSLVTIFFNFHTLKTKTRATNRWDTANSNPPEVIKLSRQ